MSTPAITVFTKRAVADDPAGSLLSKRISLVNDQAVSDGAPCRMAIGDAKVISVATAAELVLSSPRWVATMRWRSAPWNNMSKPVSSPLACWRK
jgi:hypothetical protein